jgi:hypothetical protein
MDNKYDLSILRYHTLRTPTNALERARSLEIDLHCTWCGELCRDDDPDAHRHGTTGADRIGPFFVNDHAKIIHSACFIRALLGSIGHIDPPGLTRRDAALLAYEHYLLTRNHPPKE